jgi:hypothetical protein
LQDPANDEIAMCGPAQIVESMVPEERAQHAGQDRLRVRICEDSTAPGHEVSAESEDYMTIIRQVRRAASQALGTERRN